MKLETALADSPIEPKTQIALANAIADLEELDAAPRDLVNKLFRERRVDPATVERAARALGVTASTLYMTKDDPALELPSQVNQVTSPVTPSDNSPYLKAFAIILAFVALTGLGYFGLTFWKPAPLDCRGLSESRERTADDQVGVVIGRFQGDPLNEIQILLAQSFAADTTTTDEIQIFMTCHRSDLGASSSFLDILQQQRAVAKSDLEAVDAQLFIWGERFSNRLNLRFASSRQDSETPVVLIDGKTLPINEADFSLPIRLDGNRPIPPVVKEVALSLIDGGSQTRQRLVDDLRTRSKSSGTWLQEAVITDRNLLRSLSRETDRHLYILTGNQLCYRHRLLGDFNGDEKEYENGEAVCRDVIDLIDPERSPVEWVSLHTNLGALIIRRHAYAATLEERMQRLAQAIDVFAEVEPYLPSEDLDSNASAYFRNYAVAHLRMGELTQDQISLDHLRKALSLTNRSLDILDTLNHPGDHATTLQNRCLIGHRLAQQSGSADYLDSALDDCRAATTLVTSKTAPQIWAMAQNNLAITHAMIAEMMESPDHFQIASEEFSRSQIIYSRQDYPLKWAEVETNKAELICRKALMTRDSEAFEPSLAFAESALEIFDQYDIARYSDYVRTLIGRMRSCDRNDMSTCRCSN